MEPHPTSHLEVVDRPPPMPIRSRLRSRVVRAAPYVAAALVLTMVVVGLEPRSTPSFAAPGIGDAGRTVSGWLPWWTMDASTADAVAHGDALSIASPFWYSIDGDGHVTGFNGAGSTSVVRALRGTGARVVPTVVSSMTASRAVAVFEDPTLRHRFTSRLATLARDHGFDGLDLDFERFAATDTALRAERLSVAYVTFVDELAAKLRADGRMLSVTVMARTSSTTWHPGMSATVYDYAGLGAGADVFRIMAYDRHYGGGAPGPIAPLPWVREVLDYAVALVPQDRIELGVPTFGFDWPETGRGSAVTYADAIALQSRYGVAARWSDRAAESHFRYRADGQRHTVWYADARSIRIRAALAATYGLRGIVLWTLGGEPASSW